MTLTMALLSAEPDTAETITLPPLSDLGDGFQVRRALPSVHRRMVGPFIFFDQMGPGAFRSGAGLNVHPHPHIWLATIIYLLDGEILHRDSVVRHVHSERTVPAVRAEGGRLSGLQSGWRCLPTRRKPIRTSCITPPTQSPRPRQTASHSR